MDSTVIAILLAGMVIFWKAPFSFSFIPIKRTLSRCKRRVVLVILLLGLISTQTHTSPSSSQTAARLSDEKSVRPCHKS
jgi:hypothetical protein